MGAPEGSAVGVGWEGSVEGVGAGVSVGAAVGDGVGVPEGSSGMGSQLPSARKVSVGKALKSSSTMPMPA